MPDGIGAARTLLSRFVREFGQLLIPRETLLYAESLNVVERYS